MEELIMIKIERVSAPIELTEILKTKLIEEFKADKKKMVYNKPFIRERLLEMSDSKCCYCEEMIGEGCSEMHIEHFHDKHDYPDEVVEWENLLPSCSHCNKSKSTHDTYNEPIVNPTIDNPKDIFYMKNYRYFSYDPYPKSLGKMSIGVLGINDSLTKVKLRYEIGNKLEEEIDKLYEDAIELGEEILQNTRKRNRIIKGCYNSLLLCTKKARFGASMATVLQENEDYQELRKLLIGYGLWDNGLEELHKETIEICLCKRVV